MRTVISKFALVTLIIASLALLYSVKSFAWKEYLMDPGNTDVFDEYSTVVISNQNGTNSIEMTYTGNSYWRQIEPKYRISGAMPPLDAIQSFTLPFYNNSTATLTQAPPIKVPGFANGSTVTQTYTNVNNVTVTGNGATSGTGGISGPTVVIGGSGSSSGSTGTTGSGGVIVIPSR